MNIRSIRAVTPPLLVALVATLLVALAPGAEARTRMTYTTTGRTANTNWTQVDGTPVGGTVGNVHVGWLSAEETSRGKAVVWGFIMDFDCRPGELPDHFGHFAFEDEPEPEPEPEPGCVHVGYREISGWDVPFTMDRRFQSATLKGRLRVEGHGAEGEPVAGNPMANITWTGVGTTSRENYTSRWASGGTTYTDTYRARARGATMGGTLGPMGFDPDLSGGWLVQYRSSSQMRSR